MRKKILVVVMSVAMILAITVSVNAATISQCQQRMDKAHQVAELGRYFGDSSLIAKGQAWYGQAAAQKQQLVKQSHECEASRAGSRVYLGTFKLTAYCSGCDRSGKTASGARPVVGTTVAVDPSVVALGTRLYIDGVGYRTAQDTGGVIKGNKIDVLIGTGSGGRCACASLFGTKRARVYKVI